MIFQQIFVVVAMFLICVAVSFFINKYIENKNKEKPNETKIFYITNVKKAKRKNKTPKVALKNAVIKPKEFEKYYIDDINNKD